MVGEKPSKRDQWEAILGQTAIQLGIPIVGVCRGAQLGCALAGGILVQDVSGHGGDHLIRTNDDQVLVTSSLHHQMLYPWEVDHELIAWADPELSRRYEGLSDLEEEMRDPREPEIVWFPKIKCLAIQGHPEFMDPKCKFNQYVKTLIDKYVLPFAVEKGQA